MVAAVKAFFSVTRLNPGNGKAKELRGTAADMEEEEEDWSDGNIILD